MQSKFLIGLMILNFSGGVCSGASWEIFEGTSVPTGWRATNGNTLSLNTQESLQGEQSLDWEWTAGSPKIEFEDTPWSSSGHVNSFSFWVHRETPLETAVLKVSFLKGGTVINSFEFGLSFEGWRTAFVPYRDMNGNGSAQIDSLQMEVVGVSVPTSGKILLDQVIFEKVMDSRHQYADSQVPFVRTGLYKDHWEPRVEELGRDPELFYQPDETEIAGGTVLAEAIEAELAGTGLVYSPMVDSLESEMADFGLARTADRVRGFHIFYNSYPGMAYPSDLRALVNSDGKEHDFRKYGAMQLKIAQYYHRADDPELKTRLADMYTLTAEHLLNQGWAAGSNQGSIHHIGYQIREYFEAGFLMRDVLNDAGLLNQTREAIQWYSRAGELLESFVEPNLDYYNTIAQGQLLGLLMEDDSSRRAAWLMAFQHTLSETLSTVMPGDGLGLKPDGTAFHHNGHYPAYAIGAFNTLGFIFEHLRETPFQPTVSAQAAFRRALLASRIYSQKYDWPIGISGRHPFSGNIQSLKQAFTALAAYPDPKTGITPDPEMSAARLRLWGNPGGELGAAIESAGLIPDQVEGFWSFPFANQAIARGPDWMASMKGYSKYVWSSEIYTNDNRYGRYQSNGTIEILLENGRSASGYLEAGWDWNRLPGTTGIHLPLEQLESPRTSTLMLRSNETFAGAASLKNQTGVFGFILNEPFFGNNLKARKSVSMLGDMLVALGSGIASTNASYPTETTIFQSSLNSADTPQHFGGGIGTVTGLDTSGIIPASTGIWFQDTVGTGYWVAPGQLLNWQRKEQNSFQNKNKAPTTGKFSTVWINHRTVPTNASYHYVVLPNATAEELENFHQDMQSETTAPYSVLAQTESLHAVYDNTRKSLYVSAFESSDSLDLPHLLAVSNPLLVVLEEEGSNLHIAVSNPDLKPISDGHILTPNHLLLTGLWIPDQTEDYLFWHEKGNTRIVVPTEAGLTNELLLIPESEPIQFSNAPRAAQVPPVSLNQPNPSRKDIRWESIESSQRIGWIIEKLDTDSGQFQPAAVLDAATKSWSDEDLGLNELAAYRLTEWTNQGLGPASSPLAVYQQEGFALEYDFRNLEIVDTLWDDGWIADGISDPESDLRLEPDGLLIRDNSSSAPASITLPFEAKSSGSVEAFMGVFATANFFVNLELLHDNTSLITIELTSRTDGKIETSASSVPFTDSSWDMRDGPPRKVNLAWQPIPDDEYSLEGTFFDRLDTAKGTLIETFSLSQLPNKIRISVGYGSAVNRGGLVERLSIRTGEPTQKIPFSALSARPNYRLQFSNEGLSLRFEKGFSPADFGLLLKGETSVDLVNWQSFNVESSSLMEEDAIHYPLPTTEAGHFYRFEIEL